MLSHANTSTGFIGNRSIGFHDEFRFCSAEVWFSSWPLTGNGVYMAALLPIPAGELRSNCRPEVLRGTRRYTPPPLMRQRLNHRQRVDAGTLIAPPCAVEAAKPYCAARLNSSLQSAPITLEWLLRSPWLDRLHKTLSRLDECHIKGANRRRMLDNLSKRR